MVEFKTQDGRTVRFLDKLFWNVRFNKYKIVQEVVFIYDPANPEVTATINDFFQRNTAPWWPFIVGIVVMLIGIVFRRRMKRKARIYDSQRSGAILYNPNAYKKSLNRTMWWVFVFVILTILFLIFVFGYYGEY